MVSMLIVLACDGVCVDSFKMWYCLCPPSLVNSQFLVWKFLYMGHTFSFLYSFIHIVCQEISLHEGYFTCQGYKVCWSSGLHGNVLEDPDGHCCGWILHGLAGALIPVAQAEKVWHPGHSPAMGGCRYEGPLCSSTESTESSTESTESGKIPIHKASVGWDT